MKEITCCFTGHRELSNKEIKIIKKRLNNEIDKLLNQGVNVFLSGGALGFDQLAASIVIKKQKKRKWKNIKLIMVLPCTNQNKFWTPKQKEHYRYLLNKSNKVIKTSEREYFNGCMKIRNAYLVECSSYCICALRSDKSGTGQTVRMAKERGLQIINIIDAV